MTRPDGQLLRVSNLRTYFDTDDGLLRAVDDVSFHIDTGETFALVGESGCGKSVTSFSILKLLPYPPACHPSGRIDLADLALLDVVEEKAGNAVDRGYSEKAMRSVRGKLASVIFQEPMSSLNPVFTCGSQIVEAIDLHQDLPARDARHLAIDLLDKVGIAEPASRFNAYPHQLSGGMRQRVMIAMALSCSPRLLIADEPTTALDVTIQDQILQLLAELQQSEQLSILLITHDLAVVAENARRVAVMYAGRIAETAPTGDLFGNPLHPYTQGLMRSVPKLGADLDRLETIPGSVPNPLNFPTGCKFHPRCPVGREKPRCRSCEPPLRETAPGHRVACWEAPGYEDANPPNPSS